MMVIRNWVSGIFYAKRDRGVRGHAASFFSAVQEAASKAEKTSERTNFIKKNFREKVLLSYTQGSEYAEDYHRYKESPSEFFDKVSRSCST